MEFSMENLRKTKTEQSIGHQDLYADQDVLAAQLAHC